MLLAMDTILGACSATLYADGHVLATRKLTMERGQAEALMPMVQDLLVEMNSKATAIDRIAVTVGPGSFTGVRLAVAAARALSLALDCPVAGLSTLELIAAKALRDKGKKKKTHIGAVLDGQRGQMFGQLFRVEASGTALSPVHEAEVLDPHYPMHWREYDPHLAGDGIAFFDASMTADILPDASDLAIYAAELDADRWGRHPAPHYLRPPSATPSNKPRLKVM